jgi:hypothetical protein
VVALVALAPAGAVDAYAPRVSSTGTAGYPGVGTEDALRNPDCDPATGKVRIPIQGSRALPPCVRAWPEDGDNGGPTAPGVTAGAIKVVFRTPPNFTDAEEETFRRMARDAFEMQDRLETWGREWDLAFVKGTSNDEAGQRADAVDIALTHKPFAVINHVPTGVLPVFEAELARRNIVVFGWVSLWQDLQAFPGYRYAFSMDDRIRALHIAEFVGKRLDGRRAEWAGDRSLRQKERVFGFVYPEGANLDIDFLEQQFARQGVKVAETHAYPADAERAQNHATLAVTRMRSRGVTTVIALMEFTYTIAITGQATKSDWFPEWVVTGFAALDTAVLSRTLDQKQWQHAFGIGSVSPQIEGEPNNHVTLYEWYFGYAPENGAYIGSINSPGQYLMAGVHLAGPRLTARTLQRAIFSLPPTGGAWAGFVTVNGHSYGEHLGLPWPDYSAEDDVTVKWWDPDRVSVDEIGAEGAGTWMKVDGGKFYKIGEHPRSKPRMFVERGAVANYTPDSVPEAEVPPQYDPPQGSQEN